MYLPHIPVLLQEVLEYLAPQKGDIILDATLGFAGHTFPLAQAVGKEGKIIAFEKDPTARAYSRKYLKEKDLLQRVIIIPTDFSFMRKEVLEKNISKVNAVLFDLGVSSFQLDESDRGFSYRGSVLDMRMDPKENTETAADILKKYSEERLRKIFGEYADEPLARPLAQGIVRLRKTTAISAPALVELIEQTYRRYYRKESVTHPAAKVFLALRMEVNHELEAIRSALPEAIKMLVSGGRLAIISFHGQEHHLVKEILRRESRDCLCPKEIPECKCGHKKFIHILTKKPILPSAEEVLKNPRSRSAHLYVAEKI